MDSQASTDASRTADLSPVVSILAGNDGSASDRGWPRRTSLAGLAAQRGDESFHSTAVDALRVGVAAMGEDDGVDSVKRCGDIVRIRDVLDDDVLVGSEETVCA